MNLDEIQSAIGGPNQLPAKPDGPSEVQPLNYGSPDKTAAEPFPANVEAQQGAGSSGGGLTPGASGQASDGTVQPGAGDNYSAQGGPNILAALKGLAGLTPGHNARPEGGKTLPGEPAGDPTPPRLGPDGTGQQPGHPLLKVKKL
jgi:hypothetical protein